MGQKLTALVLVMCVILTSLVLPVFSTDNDTADATPFVLLNRDFEDKTVVDNGFTGIQVAGIP